MSDHPERRLYARRSSADWKNPRKDIGARHTHGQALVEYALIAVLVCLAIAAVVTATGPTIGNIFSNTVYNLLGQKFTPEPMLDSNQIFVLATTVSQYTLPPPTYQTNTPLVPTCAVSRKWAPTKPPPDPPGTWIPPDTNNC
jgi:Flp pilus assembly pilin Flp